MAIEPYLLYTVVIISLGTFQFGYNMVRSFSIADLPMDFG